MAIKLRDCSFFVFVDDRANVPVGECFRSNCMRRWEGKGRKRGRKGGESRRREVVKGGIILFPLSEGPILYDIMCWAFIRVPIMYFN